MARKRGSPALPDPPALRGPLDRHSGPYAAHPDIPGKAEYDRFYREYDALVARCGEHGRNKNYLDAARRFEEEAFYYDRLAEEQRRAGAGNPARTGTRTMANAQQAREARRQRDRVFAVARARVEAEERVAAGEDAVPPRGEERPLRERLIAQREDL